MAVISASGATVATRVIWDVPPMVIATYSLFVLLPMYTIYAICTLGPENPSKLSSYTFNQWMLILADVLLGFLALLAASKGPQMAKSSFIALISFAGVIYGTIFDTLIFHLTLSWQQVIGTAAVFLLVIALVFENEDDKKPKDKN